MKQLILLVSLIVLCSVFINDSRREQPYLADPTNPLSLTNPETFLPEQEVNANLNSAITGDLPDNIDRNWYASVVENIMKEEYNISFSEELKTYQSPNRANNIRFTYNAHGFTAQPRETKLPLFDVNDRMLREDQKKFEEIEDWNVELRIENDEKRIDEAKIENRDNMLIIDNDLMRINYTNTKEGMRQDFIIKDKPEVGGRLEVAMKALTDLKMNVSRDAVRFSSAAGDKMKYSSLKAWDARHRMLEAYFENRGENQFAIVVNDEDAIYPVTIDPLSSTPDWERGNWYARTLKFEIVGVGDINLDGYSDVITSSVNELSACSNGHIRAYFGSANGLGSYSWYYCNRPGTGNDYGISVAGSDVNGDGFMDVIVGEPKYTNGEFHEGRIHVFYGSVLGLPDSANWKYESDAAYAELGKSLASAGDFNGDGFGDVIAGVPGYINPFPPYPPNSHGRVFIFLGSPNGLSNGPVYQFINTRDGYTGMGEAVGYAGDVNADGYSDVIVGEPYWPPPPPISGDDNYESNGKFFVSFGSPNGPSGGGGEIGEDEYSLFGYSVSTAGDVNGDGFDDVLVGAPNYWDNSNHTGKSYLYFGNANGITPAWSLGDKAAGFGTSVSTAGDLNADGFDDIIIGAHYTPWDNYQDTSGSIGYVFYGSANGIQAQGWSYAINNCPFITVNFAGDVNADGYSDILIGGRIKDDPYINDYMAVYYAFYGRPNTISITPETAYKLLFEDYFFYVSLRDPIGRPISNTEVLVEIKGANPEILSGLSTDDSGYVEYFMIGYNAGVDTIIASATNAFDTAFVFWDDPNPVELLTFTSATAGKDVTLSWSTSTEHNNSGFDIERALENAEWKKIGFVSGNGTTNEPREYSFTDRNLETGKYKYRLKQLDFTGNFEYFELAEVVSIGIPDKYDLSQNYPNPFNPVTTINYELPRDGIVKIKVYDILGHEVKTLVNEMKTAGYHRIQFNAADLASGAYFYQLVVSPSNQMKAEDFIAVKRCVVIK